MPRSGRIRDLHWGQLTVLWIAFAFAWLVIVVVASTMSPHGQLSRGAEAVLFALAVPGVAALLGVTYTWFGGRRRIE
jgi:hypothetical protein